MSDYELPSVSTQTFIKSSRKHQRCCECHEEIPVKSSYQNIKGCWVGKWHEYKTCLKCCDVRDKYYLEIGDTPPFGYLKEWCAEDGIDFREEEETSRT